MLLSKGDCPEESHETGEKLGRWLGKKEIEGDIERANKENIER